MGQGTELKTCPFCGGEATAWAPHENAHYIGCSDECIPSFEGVYHEDELICQKQWNTRAEDPIKAELIEALGDVYDCCVNKFGYVPENLMLDMKKALEKAKGDK